MIKNMTYIIGDIHDEIKNLENDSIDLIYTNPPFATTQKEWDKPLNWEELFIEMDRVLKPNGVILLHTAIPFTYDLIRIRKPKYNYVWIKNNPTNFLNAKKQPLRQVEEILVYYKGKNTYNPQMIGDDDMSVKRNKNYTTTNYYGEHKQIDSNHIGRYPTTFLGIFKRIQQKKSPKSIHDDIMIRMIKTYSNENDTILDMTCCDKNLGDISTKLNRKYIGIDISDEFL
jgi:site-specific DNA-methyltransferase (adenine-specific)